MQRLIIVDRNIIGRWNQLLVGTIDTNGVSARGGGDDINGFDNRYNYNDGGARQGSD